MKTIFLVVLALVAVVHAAPTVETPKIVRSNFDTVPEGGYVYGYETENGITREETGNIKEVLDEDKKPHQVIVVRGLYSYINDKGEPEAVNYYADESGFHAEGKSIPVAPVVRR